MPRPYALLESLRSTAQFMSPTNTAESRFRSQTRQLSHAVIMDTKPPYEPRPTRPEIDRSIDLQADTGNSVDPAAIFAQFLAGNDPSEALHPLFSLPSGLRRQIYGYCFPEERRKISLAPRFATKAVWATEHFASPWDVLEDVMGGLGAFTALRYDLMIYFWTTYHFHITLTSFSGPIFSPLSHVWMRSYLRIVQKLTVEVDLTRFGGSQLTDAPKFGYDDVNKMEKLFKTIVDGILERQHGLKMAEFNLMCRRYTGFRPTRPRMPIAMQTDSKDSDDISKQEEVPYTRDECMFLCDYIVNLYGRVQSSRMSGFTLDYTKLILSALYSIGKREPEYKTPNDFPWPTVVPGSVIIPTPKIASEFEFGLQPNKSQIETPNINTERHSNKSRMDNTPTRSDVDNVIHNDDVTTNYGFPMGSEENTLAAKGIASIPVSISSNTPLIDTLDSQESGNSMAYLPSCGVSQIAPADKTMPCPSTPERGSSAVQKESSGSRNLLSSPNTMNKLNEQDPAFRRTIDALRQLDSRKRGPNMLPALDSVLNFSSQQSETNPSGHSNLNLKQPKPMARDKAKLSVMGRIKGMFSK